MINLNFEIQILAFKRYIKTGRLRGVSRVSRELCSAFARHPQVNLRYSACSSFFILDTFLEVQKELFLPKAPFLYDHLLEAITRKKRKEEIESYLEDLTINSWQMEQSDILFYPAPRHDFLSRSLIHAKKKQVILVHDLMINKFPEYHEIHLSYHSRKLLMGMKELPLLITVSESTKYDLLEEIDYPEERVVVALLGVDTKRFYPKTKENDEIYEKYKIPCKKYFFCLSPFTVLKNVRFLIESFLNLISQEGIEDVCLVLSGSQHSFDNAEAFDIFKIMEHPLAQKYIRITGAVDDEDLIHLYSQAIALVFPSLYEGFGLPPLEAMQCGTPVISSNRSSLPEVVGDAGILLDPSDSDAWSQAMCILYNDKNKREELSQKGIERAKTFSWDKTAQNIIQAIQDYVL